MVPTTHATLVYWCVPAQLLTVVLHSLDARLKATLTESASNVEEWKTQLTHWKKTATEAKKLNEELVETRTSKDLELEEMQAKHEVCNQRLPIPPPPALGGLPASTRVARGPGTHRP